MKAFPILLLAISAGTAAAAPSAPVTPSDPKLAQELVGQLASPKYRVREKAAAELVRMGRGAKAALQDGKKHTDPEVQSRCEQLLPEALALDLAFRIDRFLTDTEGKLAHDLPLLKAYRDQVGTDENARKLFADMLKANGALLEAVEEEPAKLTDRVQQRYMAMYAEMFGNPFGAGFRGNFRPGAMNAAELCAVLFVSTQSAYKPVQPDWMLANLYTQPGFTNLLKHETDGTAHRKLFFNYVDARADDNLISQCAWMFTQHRIKAGADVMAKVLQNKKASQVYSKAQAMCCVGTLGSKEHLPILEPFLKDNTQVQPFFARGGAQQGEVKVKDVALAMTIHLNGKNPKDYGFGMWNVFRDQLIQYHQLGFATEEERTTAFKKWTDDPKKPADPKKLADPKK